MLSHRALLANIDQVAAVDPPMMHGDDVVLGVLPLFHVYGLNAVLGGIIRHRAKLVLAERFDPQGTLDLIEDEACSVVPIAPPAFAHWRSIDALEERLGPVRLVLSGSAPLSAEVIEEFVARTGVPVHQGYGLTEASPVVTSTLCSAGAPERLGRRRPRTASTSVWSRSRAPLAVGDDPGQIQIRGANLFSGYWPDGVDGPDADGWWPTGDVGFLDRSGDLFLVDRVKELIIVSGFNVYPVEVEDVVLEVPGVREVAVVGAPDDADRRDGGRLRRRAGGRRRPAGRRRARRTAAPGWPASSSPSASRSSTSCRSPAPARCRRDGCAGSSGVGPSGLIE